MTTIYLMVKTHQKTGLKYLCKTKQDPHTYRGSGKDWVPHLAKYGNLQITEIIRECYSKEELNYWGRYYSRLWNVVDAMDDFGNKIWANRIPETGGGGGSSSKATKTYPCQYCDAEYARIEFHESRCDKNPNRVRGTKTYSYTSCQYCDSTITKNQIGQHERSCWSNPDRTEHPTKGSKFPLVKCCHCDNMCPSQNLSQHQDRCDENPNKIEHPMKGIVFRKTPCDHCHKEYPVNVVAQHEPSCSANPNRAPHHNTGKGRPAGNRLI